MREGAGVRVLLLGDSITEVRRGKPFSSFSNWHIVVQTLTRPKHLCIVLLVRVRVCTLDGDVCDGGLHVTTTGFILAHFSPGGKASCMS